MPIPETTSAEAIERYVDGRCLRAGHGEAWRDIKVWIIAPPRNVEMLHLPSVSEQLLAWTLSGDQKTIKRKELNMEIKRSGSQPSGKGPAEYFTGTVRIDPLFKADAPARVFGASVTFEPGARTAWHTHPLGQTLIVTAGCGRVQRWGGPIEETRPGDVIWFPPGEKHWHGASPTTAMTHIAIVEVLDGKSADWMEKVSDEQYQAR